jgi:hypothetical protein
MPQSRQVLRMRCPRSSVSWVSAVVVGFFFLVRGRRRERAGFEGSGGGVGVAVSSGVSGGGESVWTTRSGSTATRL